MLILYHKLEFSYENNNGEEKYSFLLHWKEKNIRMEKANTTDPCWDSEEV